MSATLTVPSLPGAAAAPPGPGEPAPVASWVLRRNCSASPRQLLAVRGGLAAVGTVISAFFWSRGALLVAPFAGLEWLAVAVACGIHARHATDQERIHLQPGRLTVERHDADRIERVDLEPAAVRIATGTTPGALIRLADRARSVAVGRHVSPARRRAVAEELGRALRTLPPARTAGAPHPPDL